MRLSEVLLNGFDIDSKKIRPASVLDIIDGLLYDSNTEQAIANIENLTKSKFNGDVSGLSFICKDKVIVRLAGNQRAIKLYSKLLVNIIVGGSVEIAMKDLKDVFDGIQTTNTQYKVLSKIVDDINIALDGAVILYTQYDATATFYVIKGSTEEELLKSLEDSGFQSPKSIDKLSAICIIKGLSE